MRLSRIINPAWLVLLNMLLWPGLSLADKVVLQLPWYHQFQFAGYYAAQSQGYFAEQGIDVVIRAGMDKDNNAINPVEEVVFQRAQFGVTRSDLLVHHARGLPVVMLATIMQKTAAAFISLDKYGIERLSDVADQPVSLPLQADKPGAVIDIEVATMLARAGIDIKQLNNNPENGTLTALENGDTHLILGYATDEPYILSKRGYTPSVISPADYGIDLYGDLLFTSESTLRAQPEMVARFREAALKGWNFAMRNPEAVARYILLNYPVRAADYDLDYMMHEARTLRDYIQPDLLEIGYTNKARWERIMQAYRQAGITDPVDLDRFLYTPPRVNSLDRLLWPVITVMVGLILAIALLLWNRLGLVRQVRHSEQRESNLRRQAETDPLTGLVNRRRFSLELDVSYLRARQEHTQLSMLMLDVDHFKQINDQFGHLAGDMVLCSLARICQSVIRDTDILCRYGGEEFAFLLPETDLLEANDIAQRLMQAIRADEVEWDHQVMHYTVSIGIAELGIEDAAGLDLLRRTDRHLYRAKAAGRNTTFSEQSRRLTLVKGA